MIDKNTSTRTETPCYALTIAELARLTGAVPSAILKATTAQDLLKRGGRQLALQPDFVRRYLAERGVDFSFRVIAHINLKGGVGKTTSTVSLASRAVQYGFRVGISDMDSQGAASLAFGVVPADDDPIFIDVWQRQEQVPMALRKLQEGLYLLPSSLENGLLDISLSNPAAQKNAVRDVCATLRQNGFDLIFIDCPPSLGAAVISSACAADIVVIPVGYDAFSLKGLALTAAEINAICETFGLAEPELRILYTQFDRRVKQSLSVLEKLRSQHGPRLLPVPIRTTTLFSRVSGSAKTVFAVAGQNSAKEDYDACLRCLLRIDTGTTAAAQSPYPDAKQ